MDNNMYCLKYSTKETYEINALIILLITVIQVIIILQLHIFKHLCI